MSVGVKWLWLRKCYGAEGAGWLISLPAVCCQWELVWSAGKTAARHSLINSFGCLLCVFHQQHVGRTQQAVDCVDEQRHKWASIFFHGVKSIVLEGMATVLESKCKVKVWIGCPQMSDPGCLTSCRQSIQPRGQMSVLGNGMSPFMLLQAEQMHIKTKQQCILCMLQWGGWCTSSSLAALRGQFHCVFF